MKELSLPSLATEAVAAVNRAVTTWTEGTWVSVPQAAQVAGHFAWLAVTPAEIAATSVTVILFSRCPTIGTTARFVPKSFFCKKNLVPKLQCIKA
jgi:hypothetical protein